MLLRANQYPDLSNLKYIQAHVTTLNCIPLELKTFCTL